MKKILDYDPFNDITQTYHGNNDGTFTIQSSQDVQPYLDNNARVRSVNNKSWKGDLHEVASIPTIVWDGWWRELGDDPGAKRNKAWLIAKLNSNEFAMLRTKEGKI